MEATNISDHFLMLLECNKNELPIGSSVALRLSSAAGSVLTDSL